MGAVHGSIPRKSQTVITQKKGKSYLYNRWPLINACPKDPLAECPSVLEGGDIFTRACIRIDNTAHKPLLMPLIALGIERHLLAHPNADLSKLCRPSTLLSPDCRQFGVSSGGGGWGSMFRHDAYTKYLKGCSVRWGGFPHQQERG